MSLHKRIASNPRINWPNGARDAWDTFVTELWCKSLETYARSHITYQTEAANGVRPERKAWHADRVSSIEATLTTLAAQLPGGPWRVEFQGRGGGLCVVLALANQPDEGDGLGGGWNIGGGE